MNRKITLALMLCILAFCIFVATINDLLLVSRQITDLRHKGSQLKALIAGIPLGISSDEVTDYFGEAPHEIGTTTGVLVNASTLLAKQNPNSANHGPSRTFKFHKWSRGHTSGVVLFDSNDAVAGRWSFPTLASQSTD